MERPQTRYRRSTPRTLTRRRALQSGAALATLGAAACSGAPAAPTPLTIQLSPAAPGAAPAGTTAPAAPRAKYGGTIRTSGNVGPEQDLHK
jgi:hypothetical protein